MPSITTSDGVNLHYTDRGDGACVVLVAGFTAPAASWALQERALCDAGYRVLALDRRSHGLSDSPDHGQRMARHGKDLWDFLTALDARDAVLVGGSMGASTTWAYYDLFGPARVRGLVSIDQTPKMLNDGDWAYGFYGLTPDNVGVFFRDGIPDTGRGLPPGASIGRLDKLLEILGGPPDMRDPRAPQTRPLLQDHAQQDWRDVIGRLAVPSLFIAGRDSQYWPCEHAHAAAAANPLASAVVLDDCGHAANFDQPDAVNAALLDFLDTL
jgi:pimeloyl-ACP methyl ester carboxylesterase